MWSMLVTRAPGSSVGRANNSARPLVQAIMVWSREMRRAIRAGTTRLGPVVMK